MDVSIVGTGYVGLVTGVCLADFGNNVTCIDKNKNIIATLEAKKIPIYEPGLDNIIAKSSTFDRLSFKSTISNNIHQSHIIFIAVDTPPDSLTGEPDLTNLLSVAHSIIEDLSDHVQDDSFYTIVIKSTVPVGTCRLIHTLFSESSLPAHTYSIVSNPEFLREGCAVNDFFRPDRVVIGCNSERAQDVMKELYRPFYRIDTPIIFTNWESSELIKYASNSFLATKISFINEMALLCEKVGANVHSVAKGMGMDGRIGKYFLHPGPGYGGSCFPKDAKGLVHIGRKHGLDLKIIQATEEVNIVMKQVAIQKLKAMFDQNLNGKKIAILGLSFKPNTDDIRDSTSLIVVETLLKEGAIVRAFDPVAMEKFKAVYPNIYYGSNSYDAITGTDAIVILTEWNDFRELNLDKIKTLVQTPNIIDCRNIYSPSIMAEKNINYVSLGR